MKKLNTIRIFCLFFAVFALSISSGFSVNAQDKPHDKTGAADKVMDPMMQKWMEYATPNENHKVLGQLVGSFGIIRLAGKWLQMLNLTSLRVLVISR